jgi:hypothetical protein
MNKLFIPGAAMLLLTAAPALATAPHCQSQVHQLSNLVQEEGTGHHRLVSEENRAKRLCAQGEEERAQNVVRQAREQLASIASHRSYAQGSGDSAAPNTISR